MANGLSKTKQFLCKSDNKSGIFGQIWAIFCAIRTYLSRLVDKLSSMEESTAPQTSNVETPYKDNPIRVYYDSDKAGVRDDYYYYLYMRYLYPNTDYRPDDYNKHGFS